MNKYTENPLQHTDECSVKRKRVIVTLFLLEQEVLRYRLSEQDVRVLIKYCTRQVIGADTLTWLEIYSQTSYINAAHIKY